jgi:thioredoxin 1
MIRKLCCLVFLVPLGCGDVDSDRGEPARTPPSPLPAAMPDEPSAPPQPPAADAGIPVLPAHAAPASGRPLLMDFTRDHCLPCQIMAPWIEELRVKLGGTVDVVEINIDRSQNRELGQFFKISSIPTQVYFDRDGREVFRNVGLATRPQMERSLREHGLLGGGG